MPEEFKSILEDEMERCFKVVALAMQLIWAAFPMNNIEGILQMIYQSHTFFMKDVDLWRTYWFSNNMANNKIGYPVKSLLLMAQRLQSIQGFLSGALDVLLATATEDNVIEFGNT